MNTFTTIVDYVPKFGVEAYSIEAVARRIRDDLLNGAPRGAKALPFQYELVGKPNIEGMWMLTLRVRIVGMTGKPIVTALVISEQAVVAGRRSHANQPDDAFITCRNCGGDRFYDMGRSLDYNHHVCAGCGAQAQTLTETGASA